MTSRMVYLVPCFAAMLALGACSSDDDDGGVDPQNYYDGAESIALGAAGNGASCATCHPMGSARNGLSGATMMDIAYRTSFKGGDAATLLEGSNACVTGWMGGTALTESSDEWILLEEFLQSISDPAVTTPNVIAPEVLDDEAAYEAAYAGGDASAGEAKYTQSCGNCHDSSLRVGAGTALATASLNVFSAGRIAQKVRTSGPPPSGMLDAEDSTPGPMPFFEVSDLSQTDLADIIAFIKQ